MRNSTEAAKLLSRVDWIGAEKQGLERQLCAFEPHANHTPIRRIRLGSLLLEQEVVQERERIEDNTGDVVAVANQQLALGHGYKGAFRDP